MNLCFCPDNKGIYKKLFDLKPKQKDGLVLHVYHTDNSLKIRFVHACFDENGQILASADNDGNIFIVDFHTSKFWKISKVIGPCTVLKFSAYQTDEMLAGSVDGLVYLVNIQNGEVTGKLIGHQRPVTSLSFSHDNNMCLTSSEDEALVWDLTTNTKILVMNLERSTGLKQVNFLPATSNILACYDDSVIQVWKYGTFQNLALLEPAIWGNHSAKNLVFTRNGQIMILACHPAYLIIFIVSSWRVAKIISLPEHIQTIKSVDVLPHFNDGGCNSLLAILSGQGAIYFYDIEQNVIINELIAQYEINRFDWSCKGNYMACVLCSGDVSVYDVIQYIAVPSIEIKTATRAVSSLRKKVRLKECSEKLGLLRGQMQDVLNIDKLRLIIKEFGEYPDVYRNKIWEQLLELPNNRSQYNAIINHRMIQSFAGLNLRYPLEDKRHLKNLRKLLDNLVTWCKFFAHVDYLPVFVFPFVRIFDNKPLALFEAVCSIIVNWCQFWFEYFPLPPVNILSMIENVLMEQDPELLSHLSENFIEAKTYAWPMLKTSFSEVLTAKQWRVFWDHVLTNEPSFLLCAAVAYNILERNTLMSLQDRKQIDCFFRTHHPIDVKKLIAKTYNVLETTSDQVHPRQYLEQFKKLSPGKYPDFCGYPKTIVDYQSAHLQDMTQEMGQIVGQERDLIQQRLDNLTRMDDLIIKDEEKKRVIEMEKAVKEKLLNRQTQIEQYHERLSDLRTKLLNEEKQILDLTQKRLEKSELENRGKILESLIDDFRLAQKSDEQAAKKAEDELLLHYSNLLRQKCSIENLFQDSSDQRLEKTASLVFEQQQELLSKEIEQIRHTVDSQKHLRLLNIATGVDAANALMKKVAIELKKPGPVAGVDHDNANLRVLKLKAETGELVVAINKLLRLLHEVRNTGSIRGSNLQQ